MADAPAKDVFEDEDTGLDDDQRVVDEAEEAEEQAGTEAAAKDAGADDIEVVLAEAEKAAEGEAEGDDPDAAEDAGDKNLAAVDGAEPATDDDDLKSYSKKVQDRIERERRLVRRAREEAETAVATERAQRINAERRSLAAHKNLTAVLLVNIDGQLKAKAAELKYLLGGVDVDGNAIENATGKQVDVQGELDDLRAKKREIEGAKTSIDQQVEEFERQAKVVTAPAAPKVTEATQTWLGQNKWFSRKGFAAETLLVRELDNKLATERSDKGSPGYFQELNRRIRAEMPDLTDKVRRAFKPATRSVSSSVAPVSRTASARTDAPSKRRVTLDKQDLQNMREFKLDPTNKEHVAAYAREKLAAQ